MERRGINLEEVVDKGEDDRFNLKQKVLFIGCTFQSFLIILYYIIYVMAIFYL